MARLAHGEVVGARRDEGLGGVEGALVEESVDADCEEGGEGVEERGVGVEDWEAGGWRGGHGLKL